MFFCELAFTDSTWLYILDQLLALSSSSILSVATLLSSLPSSLWSVGVCVCLWWVNWLRTCNNGWDLVPRTRWPSTSWFQRSQGIVKDLTSFSKQRNATWSPGTWKVIISLFVFLQTLILVFFPCRSLWFFGCAWFIKPC